MRKPTQKQLAAAYERHLNANMAARVKYLKHEDAMLSVVLAACPCPASWAAYESADYEWAIKEALRGEMNDGPEFDTLEGIVRYIRWRFDLDTDTPRKPTNDGAINLRPLTPND